MTLDFSRVKDYNLTYTITCCSCGEECDATAPIEGEFMCEDCVG